MPARTRAIVSSRMSTPSYISIVLPPFARLAFLSDAARDNLAKQGFAIETDASGYPAIRFKDSGGSLLSNASFVEAFRRLNQAGIAFGEDFTQDWSPAEVMRELQKLGQITESFTALAWRGQDSWFTTVHETRRNG